MRNSAFLSRRFSCYILGAFHNNFSGFACWGDFILMDFKISFALAQHSQDKNENHDKCLTTTCLLRCSSETEF